MALMKASQENIETMVEACLGGMEARINACQGPVKTEIETDLGEM
jgi:hypothetical protein